MRIKITIGILVLILIQSLYSKDFIGGNYKKSYAIPQRIYKTNYWIGKYNRYPETLLIETDYYNCATDWGTISTILYWKGEDGNRFCNYDKFEIKTNAHCSGDGGGSHSLTHLYELDIDSDSIIEPVMFEVNIHTGFKGKSDGSGPDWDSGWQLIDYGFKYYYLDINDSKEIEKIKFDLTEERLEKFMTLETNRDFTFWLRVKKIKLLFSQNKKTRAKNELKLLDNDLRKAGYLIETPSFSGSHVNSSNSINQETIGYEELHVLNRQIITEIEIENKKIKSIQE